MASDVIVAVYVPNMSWEAVGDIEGRYGTGSLIDNDWLWKGP